jgi:DNA-binding transcriptional regulator YiaG
VSEMTPADFRALQAGLGLTVARTAALCGVTPDAVARWRSGNRKVPVYAVRLLEAERERRDRLSVAAT